MCEKNKGWESRLSVESSANCKNSSVEICGSGTEILFNLTVLIRDVCRNLGIPPVVFAQSLPAAIHKYEKDLLNSESAVDMGEINEGGGLK